MLLILRSLQTLLPEKYTPNALSKQCVLTSYRSRGNPLLFTWKRHFLCISLHYHFRDRSRPPYILCRTCNSSVAIIITISISSSCLVAAKSSGEREQQQLLSGGGGGHRSKTASVNAPTSLYRDHLGYLIRPNHIALPLNRPTQWSFALAVGRLVSFLFTFLKKRGQPTHNINGHHYLISSFYNNSRPKMSSQPTSSSSSSPDRSEDSSSPPAQHPSASISTPPRTLSSSIAIPNPAINSLAWYVLLIIWSAIVVVTLNTGSSFLH